jgi:hypothetical protein
MLPITSSMTKRNEAFFMYMDMVNKVEKPETASVAETACRPLRRATGGFLTARVQETRG